MKKAELHLHLDGSLRIKTAYEEYIKIKNEKIDFNEFKNNMQINSNCKNLIEYLQKFEIPLEIMQTKEILEKTSFELLEDLHNENYIYAEIRFAPHLHMKKGLKLNEIVEFVLNGMKRAEEKYGIKFGLILCIMRHMNLDSAYEILELYNEFKNNGVCGIDLAGDEYNYPVLKFSDFFKSVENINLTIHAGEASSFESVKNAINLGAKRIGHGIRSFEDEKTMELIKKNDILLEICPISNFQTKVLKNFENYPIRKFLDYGINLSLNTDNKTVSNTNLDKEYNFLNEYFDINLNEYKLMIENSIKYAFLKEEEKKDLLIKLKN